VCLRLYTRGSFEARPAADTPELLRDDLAELTLLLSSLGLSASDLRFPTPPPDSAWTSARELLESLGALDGAALERGALTALGARMARLPLPPRLGRLVLDGEARGIPGLACRAAALLSERDLLLRDTLRTRRDGRDVELGDSDLDLRLSLLEEAISSRFSPAVARASGVDREAARSVERVAAQLEQLLARTASSGRSDARGAPAAALLSDDAPGAQEALLTSLLTAFPDRVAARRAPGTRLLLASGAQAELGEDSVVRNAALLLALSADFPRGRRGGAVVRLAVRLSPDWLIARFPERVVAEEELSYDPERDVVDELSRLRFGRVVLDESRQRARPGPAVARELARAALQRGPAVFDPKGRLASLVHRLKLLRTETPELLGDLTAAAEGGSTADAVELAALEAACAGSTSLGELRALDLGELAAAGLPASVAETLRREAPESLRLPGGRKVPIHYEPDRPPWVESRLQDFFGQTRTPSVCRGRVAVAVHLLAPNHRAVQVTSDLDSFWRVHYPELRRQLMRRYPRHAWPEDGASAEPPPRGRPR
jgi:ATP-dependent helicase HrpB